MNGHPRDQAKVSVHCRWPLITGNLTLKCVDRGIDNVAVQGRWPLTTGVAQDRYYCSNVSSIVSFFCIMMLPSLSFTGTMNIMVDEPSSDSVKCVDVLFSVCIYIIMPTVRSIVDYFAAIFSRFTSVNSSRQPSTIFPHVMFYQLFYASLSRLSPHFSAGYLWPLELSAPYKLHV